MGIKGIDSGNEDVMTVVEYKNVNPVQVNRR